MNGFVTCLDANGSPVTLNRAAIAFVHLGRGTVFDGALFAAAPMWRVTFLDGQRLDLAEDPLAGAAAKELPTAESGRIPWDGGECPVPATTFVHVEFRDGCDREGPAGSFEWKHDPDFYTNDIVAYIVPRLAPAALQDGASAHAFTEGSDFPGGAAETPSNTMRDGYANRQD